MAPPTKKYQQNDKVLCSHGQYWYLAKIVDVQDEKSDNPVYTIHYQVFFKVIRRNFKKENVDKSFYRMVFPDNSTWNIIMNTREVFERTMAGFGQ